uniref:probable RNA-binding protein CG14230 n=1 Tax=Vespula vulgaris TaxID=7454 RepID=UPI002121A187|nr:probable RNA-binding protein CG14230 [Vespula vulgaris]XP_050844553.1 probable RNA-binding protein CG14230 [Vespula vulgaris]XP_050844554.1 probable RNA-binding protein CG14230 [Vespula vulgaris]
MIGHIEAEKKRLLSLKRKKEAFKVKEQLIRDALKGLDNKKANNKIVFDDSIEKNIATEKEEKKCKILFDNEDDDEEVTWNDDKFKTKKDLDEKYIKLQASFGNDSRFTLDNRFIEENVQNEEGKEVNECDLENEKEWQFNILEDVLGAPIATKLKNEETVKKFAMIRYDPTEDKHKQYELTMEENKSSAKTKKRKKKIEIGVETNKDEPVVVSKDVYYSVSDSLTKSLNQQQGEFSLLKTYGKDIDETDKKNVAAVSTKINEEMPKKQKSFLNFDSANPFKYDSSDDENGIKLDIQRLRDHKEEKESNHLFVKDSDNFFFSRNDRRFEDALDFFKKEFAPNNEFKNLRRELKQIVRAKVRKNVKRTEKWGSRKKIKKLL